MILQQQEQEYSIGSDLEKTKLSIIHITRARLCSDTNTYRKNIHNYRVKNYPCYLLLSM